MFVADTWNTYSISTSFSVWNGKTEASDGSVSRSILGIFPIYFVVNEDKRVEHSQIPRFKSNHLVVIFLVLFERGQK